MSLLSKSGQETFPACLLLLLPLAGHQTGGSSKLLASQESGFPGCLSKEFIPGCTGLWWWWGSMAKMLSLKLPLQTGHTEAPGDEHCLVQIPLEKWVVFPPQRFSTKGSSSVWMFKSPYPQLPPMVKSRRTDGFPWRIKSQQCRTSQRPWAQRGKWPTSSSLLPRRGNGGSGVLRPEPAHLGTERRQVPLPSAQCSCQWTQLLCLAY